jgi:diguanylate cyclase (GGDEF)-like protein/PAS domain S-box-containing protein
LNKQTILIVDDEPINLKMLSSLLKDKYFIKIANSGKNAIKIVEKEHLDLILLDIMMPETNGFEVAKIIKNDKKLKDVPIIFITAKKDNDTIVKGFNAGAIDFISKPFSNEELSIRIKTHLEFYYLKNQLNKAFLKTERQLKIIDQYVIYSQTDLKGNIKTVSDAFCLFSGFSKEELIGKNHNIVSSGETKLSVFKNLWEKITNNLSWDGEFINAKKDKSIYYTKVRISPEYDENGEKIGYIGFFQDITDKKVIEKLAETDHLTQLFNRQKIDKCLNLEYQNKNMFSILMLDIDHFKSVNDTYGHQVGDSVLIELSQEIKENIRNTDIAGRFGGEEFIIILPNTNKADAKNLAEKLRKKIEAKNFSVIGKKTISIGVSSLFAEKNDSINELIKRTDQALYQAKNSGRNRVEVL